MINQNPPSDNIPSPYSSNTITSRGVYDALSKKEDSLNGRGNYGDYVGFDMYGNVDINPVLLNVYNVAGTIMSSDTETMRGVGIASVIVYMYGWVRIEFTYKIVANDFTVDTMKYGLNIYDLKNLNNELPSIITISGGHGLVYNADGTLDTNKVHYGLYFVKNSGFWVPSRIYTENGNTGMWESRAFL